MSRVAMVMTLMLLIACGGDTTGPATDDVPIQEWFGGTWKYTFSYSEGEFTQKSTGTFLVPKFSVEEAYRNGVKATTAISNASLKIEAVEQCHSPGVCTTDTEVVYHDFPFKVTYYEEQDQITVLFGNMVTYMKRTKPRSIKFMEWGTTITLSR